MRKPWSANSVKTHVKVIMVLIPLIQTGPEPLRGNKVESDTSIMPQTASPVVSCWCMGGVWVEPDPCLCSTQTASMGAFSNI